MKKLLLIIFFLYLTSVFSFADNPKLKLECRMLEGDIPTDIFFERDLNQSFLYKILKNNAKEIEFTYTHLTDSKNNYLFNKETNILIVPAVDDGGNQTTLKAKCNDPILKQKVFTQSDENLSWKIRSKFIKPECLTNHVGNYLYLWESFDNYEEFYSKYMGVKGNVDEWKDKNFKKFVNNIGLYLNKEVPLNHKINPSWSDTKKISLTKNLSNCLSETPSNKHRLDGWNYSYKIVEDINLNEAKKLAPNIDQEFISIKSLKTNDNSMAIFGILSFHNDLIMVPLKILNTW